MKHFDLCNNILSKKSVQRDDVISFLSDFTDKIKAPSTLLPALIQGLDANIVDLGAVIRRYYENTDVTYVDITYKNHRVKSFIYKPIN